MMISTKGRYALRVMVDLAEHQTEGYIPLKEIADRQEISEKYLENILKVLVKARFLTGLRGKGGGYRLSRAPESYTVGSILRLTEGTLAPVACLEEGADACPRTALCRTLPMWKKLDALIAEFFDGITIADLMAPEDPGNDYII
ncbi:MAG: RrF2 family transcriptional regulator [Oscillospiraceae bacterium]|nr:RrF2 family transcriptional regulator [Oscillospiraceae bacterium]